MNKKILSVLLVLVMVCGIAWVAHPEVVKAAGTTYYVSYTSGNNSNNGTSSNTPWKDFTKLNTVTFQPGDTILLKRGDTWANQTFYPKGNGNYSTGQWITLDAYGTGDKPVICS